MSRNIKGVFPFLSIENKDVNYIHLKFDIVYICEVFFIK